MRLVFTGRAVRSSRKLWARPLTTPLKIPLTPWRGINTDPSVVDDTEDTEAGPLPTRRLGHSRSFRGSIDFEPIDLHPKPEVEHKEGRLTGTEQGDGLPTQPPEGGGEEVEEATKPVATDANTNTLFSPPQYRPDASSNLSAGILKLVDRSLYTQPDHPICITRKLIESVFMPPTYQRHIASNPIVSTAMNFDALGFGADHPGRSSTDTYYLNRDHVLRTHTSAHQDSAFRIMALANASPGYTICADVFRRDSIDRSHFPVFHQMEGARLWARPKRTAKGTLFSNFKAVSKRIKIIKADLEALGPTPVAVDDPNPAFHDTRNPRQLVHDKQEVRLMVTHLKRSLELLIRTVFQSAGHLSPGQSDQLKVRWVEAQFPFTTPSWELEVQWQEGQWLEVLGCGIVQQLLLHRAGIGDRIGWAWGIGIERLAMLLFAIPDIRLFWSRDPRFLSQFSKGRVTKFKPFSQYPECYKDVTFWVPADGPAQASTTNQENTSTGAASANTSTDAASAGGHSPPPTTTSSSKHPSEHPSKHTNFHENDLMQLVRDVAGPLAEDVQLLDAYVHPTSGRRSLCYRVVYRSLERTLTNVEVNDLHATLCRRLEEPPASEGPGGGLGVELR